MLLVSGWFHVSETIIPEAGSTFLPLHNAATLILSVDWGLSKAASGESWATVWIWDGLDDFLEVKQIFTDGTGLAAKPAYGQLIREG